VSRRGTQAGACDSNRYADVAGSWGNSELTGKLKVLILIAALAPAAAVHAQQSPAYPGYQLDARTLNVQAKAEESFESEDYDRAHFIYLNDLAPIGDKYAQYMLGFMSLNGLGVAEDPVLASAWYRLAAERNGPQFVNVRDDLLRRLDAVDLGRSDEIYLRLRREYSDIVIAMREARKNFEDLSTIATGSRLGSPSAAVTIVRPRAGSSMSGDAYYRDVHRRMQEHLDHVTAVLGIERIEGDISAAELASLEERVRDYVARVDDR